MKIQTIYIPLHNHVVTGGIEAMYQLYYSLKTLGKDVKLILLDLSIHPQHNPNWLELHKLKLSTDYPKVYEKYKIDPKDIVSEIKDSKNNFIITPEIFPDILSTFKNIQKGIWWLSVDNGMGDDQRDFITQRLTPDIWNFYQSEYAHWFLINKGAQKLAKLTDFISWEYRDLNINIKNKKDIILYNPKKGRDITNKIIETHPQFTFIPIQNLTPPQIKNLMLESKLYIDFGNHPGKDRIPREAALCGCCVITNFKGSAMFFDDVNIYNTYKFENDLTNLVNLIPDIFNKFEFHHSQFSFYRSQIEFEEEQFILETKKIFN